MTSSHSNQFVINQWSYGPFTTGPVTEHTNYMNQYARQQTRNKTPP